MLLLLENDGWAHYYTLDLATKELKQLTFGKCEDSAHAGDFAVWRPTAQVSYMHQTATPLMNGTFSAAMRRPARVCR